jgi:hypothetical protein
MIYCDYCGKELKEDEFVVQIRRGYIEGGDFYAETDLGYYHSDCFDNFNHPSTHEPENERR